MSRARVWACLLSGENYLPGLLTLNYSLKQSGSKYSLLVLHTADLPQACHKELDSRHIEKLQVPYLAPSFKRDFGDHPHYADVYTKLYIFKLVEFERIVLLDLDMLIVQNMDELFELPLDGKPFASTQACSCNAAKRPGPPLNWPAIYKTVATSGWEW